MNFVIAALPIVAEWAGKIIAAVQSYRQKTIDAEQLKAKVNHDTMEMVDTLMDIDADVAANNTAADAKLDDKFDADAKP